MTTLQLVIVCVTFLITVGLIVGLINARLPGETPPAPEPEPAAITGVLAGLSPLDDVAVHIHDGQSFRGVVHTVSPGRLVLTGASLVTGATQTPLSGRAHIPESAILMVQEKIAPSDGTAVE